MEVVNACRTLSFKKKITKKPNIASWPLLHHQRRRSVFCFFVLLKVRFKQEIMASFIRFKSSTALLTSLCFIYFLLKQGLHLIHIQVFLCRLVWTTFLCIPFVGREGILKKCMICTLVKMLYVQLWKTP